MHGPIGPSASCAIYNDNEFTVFSKATYKFNKKWTAYGDLQGRFLTYKTSGLTSDRVPLEVDEKYNFFNSILI